jgi:hypothetical protein
MSFQGMPQSLKLRKLPIVYRQILYREKKKEDAYREGASWHKNR